jgi:hypothetical protein
VPARETMDYILHNDLVDTIEVLEMPTEDEITV